MPTRTLRPLPIAAALLAVTACTGEEPAPAEETVAAAGGRPATVSDTLMVEGMGQPIRLELYRAGSGFPLPFSAYVPADMATEREGDTSIQFVAEFGGVRNERAFVHLFVHPPGTDPQEALGLVRAYTASTGVPVSQGIEPLEPPAVDQGMAWADHAYGFRYQAGGTWYLGSIGLGSHQGRLFHLVTHYPAEYGDGFSPRADLLLDSWRWADGSPLRSGPAPSDITIPSARADSLPP